MRGLSAGSQASQGSAATGLWPNVAIYLDNQSAQVPNRNLDIYAADLNRIEVLEGPQGTLFGAGAEAGVIRYITNEPKLDVTEGSVKAGYGVTAHGDPNADATAVINLPIIEGTMAVRAVIYDDHRGGYINNVPGTFTRKDTDIGIHYGGYATGCSAGVPTGGACPTGSTPTTYGVPPGSPSLNNNNLVGNAINPVTYQGIRAEALYKFNEDWNLLVTQSYQNLNSQGVFYQQPNASDGAALSPLEVTLFNPAYDKDNFESTAWTLNGKLGPISAVYTGGYLDRNVDQAGDYTNYSRGVYADYYQCVPGTCYSPSAAWHSKEQNEHLQNELRFSTPDDWRLRGIAGVYEEDNKLYDQTTWMYKNIPACTANGAAGYARQYQLPHERRHLSGQLRAEPGRAGRQHLVLSGSVSRYQADGVLPLRRLRHHPEGADHHGRHPAFPVREQQSRQCPLELRLLRGRHPGRRLSRSGVQLQLECAEPAGHGIGLQEPRQHHLAHHAGHHGLLHLLAGLPAGRLQPERRRGTCPWTGWRGAIPDSALVSPPTSSPTTRSAGRPSSSTTACSGTARSTARTGTTCRSSSSIPASSATSSTTPTARTSSSRASRPRWCSACMSGLTVQGAASWNHSRQTNSPALIDNNPASVNYGKPITQVCSGATCTPVTNPFGPIGAPSADAPPLQFSVRGALRVERRRQLQCLRAGRRSPIRATRTPRRAPIRPFCRAPTVQTSRGAVRDSRLFDRRTRPSASPRIPGGCTLNGENLANSNASTFISTDQFIVEQTPLRPRVIGASFGYKF